MSPKKSKESINPSLEAAAARARERVLSLPERKPTSRNRLEWILFFTLVLVGSLWQFGGERSEDEGYVPSSDLAQWLLVPFPFSPLVGKLFLVVGLFNVQALRKRSPWNVTAHKVLTRDTRPPVLFCRGFRYEGTSESSPIRRTFQAFQSPLGMFWPGSLLSLEERIFRTVQRVGPFVAIGNPRETLPTTGARRVYCSDGEWQNVFETLIAGARAVIMAAPITPVVGWELETIWSRGHLSKLFLIFEQDSVRREVSYSQLRSFFLKTAPFTMPEQIGKFRILHFGPDGEIQLTTEKRRMFRDSIEDAIRRAFRTARLPIGKNPGESIFTRDLSFLAALGIALGIFVFLALLLFIWAAIERA